MVRICIAIVQLAVSIQLVAQQDWGSTENPFLEDSLINLIGTLDKSLPVKLLIKKKGLDIAGTISYGDNHLQYELEGKIGENQITLYEIDEDQRVTSFIEGPVTGDTYYWIWKRADHTLELPLIVCPDKNQGLFVEKYVSDEINSQIYLRNHVNQISIDTRGKINHRWIDFICEEESCYEIKPNILLTNPIEFQKKNQRRQHQIFVFPETYYDRKATIRYKNISVAGFKDYYSFVFPDIDKVFNDWAEETILAEIAKHSLSHKTQPDQYFVPADRFNNRAYGDFYLTMLTNDIISGYLIFYGTHTTKMKTIAFNYDRRKKQSFGLQEIFRSDFDYPFFLKKFLEKKKKGMILKEPRIIKRLFPDFLPYTTSHK